MVRIKCGENGGRSTRSNKKKKKNANAHISLNIETNKNISENNNNNKESTNRYVTREFLLKSWRLLALFFFRSADCDIHWLGCQTRS